MTENICLFPLSTSVLMFQPIYQSVSQGEAVHSFPILLLSDRRRHLQVRGSRLRNGLRGKSGCCRRCTRGARSCVGSAPPGRSSNGCIAQRYMLGPSDNEVSKYLRHRGGIFRPSAVHGVHQAEVRYFRLAWFETAV